MYETGPWQMSFMWAGFYNTNGNGNGERATHRDRLPTRDHHHCGCGGVPGVNSTCFNGNPATALRLRQDTVNKWEIGANYALGPGVKLTGGAMTVHAGGPTNAASGNSRGPSCSAWTCASSRRPTSTNGKSGRKPALFICAAYLTSCGGRRC